MADRFLILLGFIVGLGPTFGLLWAVMSRYENTIAERDTNASFVLGIFAGILVITTHLFFVVSYDTLSSLIFAPVLALAECLLYYIYLNRRKLKSRSDKPFLGLAFALGAASMYIGFLMGHLTTNLDYNIEHVLGLVIFAVGASTIRGSMGILMARSTSKKQLLKTILAGTPLLGIFNIMAFFYLNSDIPFLWTFSIPCTVYALAVFWYYFKDLGSVEKFVPKE
jgi:hypothetical protein